MCDRYIRFDFDDDIPTASIEETLDRSLTAAESLYGATAARIEVSYALNPENRACVIDAGTPCGSVLTKVFTALVSREFGDGCFSLSRCRSAPPTQRDFNDYAAGSDPE